MPFCHSLLYVSEKADAKSIENALEPTVEFGQKNFTGRFRFQFGRLNIGLRGVRFRTIYLIVEHEEDAVLFQMRFRAKWERIAKDAGDRYPCWFTPALT